MALTFVGGGISGIGAGGGNIDLTDPGVAAGDMQIVGFATPGAHTVTVVPAEWVLLASTTKVSIYWRRVISLSTQTFTFGAASGAVTEVNNAWRNAADPVGAAAFTSVGNVAITHPAVTVAYASSAVVAMTFMFEAAASSANLPSGNKPSGYTFINGRGASVTPNAYHAQAYKTGISAGTETPGTWSIGGADTGHTGVGFSIAIAPENTMTITAPTAAASVTGGPNLTVSWTVNPPAGKVQTSRRVRLQDDAGVTTYYDTGVVTSATTTVTMDLVALGVTTDTTDIKAVVDLVFSDAATNTATVAFDVLWGVVTTAITSPASGAVVSDSTPDVVTTFSSTRSKTMTHYRYVVTITALGVTYFDSGWVASSTSPLTITLPTLADNSRYTVTVTHKNSEGVTS